MREIRSPAEGKLQIFSPEKCQFPGRSAKGGGKELRQFTGLLRPDVLLFQTVVLRRPGIGSGAAPNSTLLFFPNILIAAENPSAFHGAETPNRRIPAGGLIEDQVDCVIKGKIVFRRHPHLLPGAVYRLPDAFHSGIIPELRHSLIVNQEHGIRISRCVSCDGLSAAYREVPIRIDMQDLPDTPQKQCGAEQMRQPLSPFCFRKEAGKRGFRLHHQKNGKENHGENQQYGIAMTADISNPPQQHPRKKERAPEPQAIFSAVHGQYNQTRQRSIEKRLKSAFDDWCKMHDHIRKTA
ncbi:MAG: hypothetical protein HP002_12315 [Lentisphaeria bacterium]|nr:hypothetical protein [Lentisphaeria bacterium]